LNAIKRSLKFSVDAAETAGFAVLPAEHQFHLQTHSSVPVQTADFVVLLVEYLFWKRFADFAVAVVVVYLAETAGFAALPAEHQFHLRTHCFFPEQTADFAVLLGRRLFWIGFAAGCFSCLSPPHELI
jgi:hypothetical protein